MDNNDILIRLRYALDLKDDQMANIFKLGDVDVTVEEVKKILIKPEIHQNEDEKNSYVRDIEGAIACTNDMLDGFLNGLITYKRGKQESKPGSEKKSPLSITSDRHVNNIMLKKLKIALSLTSEDMLDIFESTETYVTKGELSAVLRRQGQRNYKECGDRYARNFLKGLTIKYRK